jgi:hypothetical protein
MADGTWASPRSGPTSRACSRSPPCATARRWCADETASSGRAVEPPVRHAGAMTAPDPDLPEARDIALEQESPELAAELEAQSDPETGEPSGES